MVAAAYWVSQALSGCVVVSMQAAWGLQLSRDARAGRSSKPSTPRSAAAGGYDIVSLTHRVGFGMNLLLLARCADPVLVHGVYSDDVLDLLSYNTAVSIISLFFAFAFLSVNVAFIASRRPSPVWIKWACAVMVALSFVAADASVAVRFHTRDRFYTFGLFLVWLAFAELVMVALLDVGMFRVLGSIRRVLAAPAAVELRSVSVVRSGNLSSVEAVKEEEPEEVEVPAAAAAPPPWQNEESSTAVRVATAVRAMAGEADELDDLERARQRNATVARLPGGSTMSAAVAAALSARSDLGSARFGGTTGRRGRGGDTADDEAGEMSAPASGVSDYSEGAEADYDITSVSSSSSSLLPSSPRDTSHLSSVSNVSSSGGGLGSVSRLAPGEKDEGIELELYYQAAYLAATGVAAAPTSVAAALAGAAAAVCAVRGQRAVRSRSAAPVARARGGARRGRPRPRSAQGPRRRPATKKRRRGRGRARPQELRYGVERGDTEEEDDEDEYESGADAGGVGGPEVIHARDLLDGRVRVPTVSSDEEEEEEEEKKVEVPPLPLHRLAQGEATDVGDLRSVMAEYRSRISPRAPLSSPGGAAGSGRGDGIGAVAAPPVPAPVPAASPPSVSSGRRLQRRNSFSVQKQRDRSRAAESKLRKVMLLANVLLLVAVPAELAVAVSTLGQDPQDYRQDPDSFSVSAHFFFFLHIVAVGGYLWYSWLPSRASPGERSSTGTGTSNSGSAAGA